MFKIVNEQGLTMELNPDDKITIEKNNPLFNDADKLFQDISWSGKAGFTENNKAFFGLGNLVEASNATYRFAIQMLSGTDVFLVGNIKYRVGPDGFEYNLEPNLVAINSLLKNININEIISMDADYSLGNFSAIEARMLDAAQHPEKYGYVFCPVLNESFDMVNSYIAYPFINYFDKTTQKFVAKVNAPRNGGNYDMYTLLSPYYKLVYILQVIAQYLSLTPTGNIFTDAKFLQKYIYTQQALLGYVIGQSTAFLPTMLITDFLKKLRDRYHVSMDFDLNSGQLTIETFRSILASDAIDISAYVTNTLEQELPDSTGSLVTLKSDSTDAEFKVTVDGQDTYPALYQLTSGDYSTPTELDCSTLYGVDNSTPTLRGERYCKVNQLTYQEWQASDGSTLTNTGNLLDYNNFPLRVFNYMGYNEITPGVFYPESTPDNLDEDDLLWYQFLNDSKRLILYCVMPGAVLAGMKVAAKYCFKTSGYNFCSFIIEKIAYDIGINDELVRVKIYARTINFSSNTPVSISPVQLAAGTGYTFYDGTVQLLGRVKAYFDPIIHGFNTLTVQVAQVGTSNWIYTIKPITSPCNIKGCGGVSAGIYNVTPAAMTGSSTQQLRIYQGAPQYLIHQGIKHNFINAGAYYYVNVDLGASQSAIHDYYTIFF